MAVFDSCFLRCLVGQRVVEVPVGVIALSVVEVARNLMTYQAAPSVVMVVARVVVVVAVVNVVVVLVEVVVVLVAVLLQMAMSCWSWMTKMKTRKKMIGDWQLLLECSQLLVQHGRSSSLVIEVEVEPVVVMMMTLASY